MDLHSMCTMGLLEQKGQSRNTYYIAGPRYEEISKGDGEISRAFPEELIGKCKRLKNGNPRTR